LANDKISLMGMSFYGFHGVNPEERALGQRFSVDVDLERDLSLAGVSDRLDDTVDYTKVYLSVREIIQGLPRNLLEALAVDIADMILDRFRVEAVKVRVEKTRLVIGKGPSSASVEIYRKRGLG